MPGLNLISNPNRSSNLRFPKYTKILLSLMLLLNFGVKMIYSWAPIYIILSHVTFDDTFYFLKVARNIALNHVISFDGIEMTNGFQPLWEILLVPIMFFTKNRETALSLSLSLSSLLGIGTSLFLYKIVTILCNEGAALLAVLIWSTNIHLIRMETSGMEFSLSGLMLSWFIYFYIKRIKLNGDFNSSNYFSLGLLAAFVVLARVDAIFLIFSFLVLILFEKKNRFKKALNFSFSSSIILLPYLAWNLICFDHVMPISGAVKEWISNRIIEVTYNGYFNLSYFKRFIVSQCLQGFLDITGIFNIYFIPLTKYLPFLEKNIEIKVAIFLFLSLLCAIIYSVIRSGKGSKLFTGLMSLSPIFLFIFFHYTYYHFYSFWEPMGTYYAVEYLIVVILVSISLDFLFSEVIKSIISNEIILKRMTYFLIFSISLYSYILLWNYGVKNKIQLMDRSKITSGTWPVVEMLEAAKWINKNVSKDAIIGCWDAGIIGYFSDCHVVSLDGLVNNFELLKFKKEGNIDKYIKKKNITYIAQFFNEDEMKNPVPYRRAYMEIKEFNKIRNSAFFKPSIRLIKLREAGFRDFYFYKLR